MDSGNSGSLQSSSGGGDDEYDSRATVTTTTTTFINNHPPPPPSSSFHPHHHNNPPSLFDPLSNYFDPRTSSNQNSLLNLDPLIWSKPDQQINPFLSPPPTSSSLPAAPPPLPPVISQSAPSVRNPKKRTRASRRAPTTVLTTDTSNFRAMVQEFTGIPAPPFSSSSPSSFSRSRLDFFGTSSSIRSNPNTFDNTPPPYLLRPFPQKLQPPPFLNSTPPQIAGGSNSNLQNSFQSNFFNQSVPSSSFLAGLAATKTHNSVEVRPASSNDHQFGQMSGSTRDGSNYNSYSTGSFQSSETMMNVNATRGEGMVESWICSTSD